MQGFEKDLEFYQGATWREQPINSAKATAAYVAHLKALGDRDATLLLAHAFTQARAAVVAPPLRFEATPTGHIEQQGGGAAQSACGRSCWGWRRAGR